MTDIYDVIIVGGGVAGMSACLYSSRNNLKTLIIEKMEFGGQLLNTHSITNYIGASTVDSWELAKNMKEDALRYGAEVLFDEVIDYEYKVIDNLIHVKTTTGKTILTKTIILATGTKHIELDTLKHISNGVSYCAVCDAEFTKGKNVAVIGGGDTAFESALLISNFADSVDIIIRSMPRAKEYLFESVKHTKNIKMIYNNEISSAQYNDSSDKISVELISKDEKEYDSIFVCIGSKPEYIKHHSGFRINNGYYIPNYDMLTNTISGHTNNLQISYNTFMAGDMIHPKHRQVAIAVSDGAVASLEAYNAVLRWKNKI